MSEINLNEIFSNIRSQEEEITEAQADLAKLEGKLASYKDNEKEKLVKRIENGESTGNPLQDEVIRIIGLNKVIIDTFLNFNDTFRSSKEVLIEVDYGVTTKHVMKPTESSQNEYPTLTGYIFGIPSGGNIILKKSSWIMLPFKKYVIWGFNYSDTKHPQYSSLEIDGFMGEWNAQDVISSIYHLRHESGVRFHMGHMAFSRSLNIELKLKQGRELIEKSTPEEMFISSDI